MSDKTTKKAKRSTISISSEVRDRLNALITAKVFQGTHSEFLDHVLEQYSGNDVFHGDNFDKINEAAEASGMTTEAIVVTGALKYAELLIDAKKDNRTLTDTKIHTLVTDTMVANEAAKEWWDKVEITKGWIAKTTGSNRKNVNAYVLGNQTTLDAHHAKCGIEVDHNRRVFNYNRKLNNAKDKANEV